MTPQSLLTHLDTGQPWHGAHAGAEATDMATAYRTAAAVRELRIARGERPVGYKVGFTNRGIWSRYNVSAPIWGTVWDSTITYCEDDAQVSLAGCCQPRLEPEVVFGLRAVPSCEAPSLDDLLDCVDWMAPGLEVVQSHSPEWRFTAADTVADGGLHARLLVGSRLDVRAVGSAAALEAQLASANVSLCRGGAEVERGQGATVMDGPLHALRHFVTELYQSANAPSLRVGDVVTTGTWTDAWPVHVGESWMALFSAPLKPLGVRFT